MTSNWPVDTILSIHHFEKWLTFANQQRQLVYRGQANSCWHLQPSLDRDVPETDCFKDRVPKEKEYIESFCDQARRYLVDPELGYLKDPAHRVLRMTLMQHYGAPTRLLDWSQSSAIAAYFACVDKRHLDGTIWWVNGKGVEDWLTRNWDNLGYKRRPYPTSQINLNDRIDDPTVPPFVSMTHLPAPFDRAKVQHGLFTFGSQPGLAHDDQLKKQLKHGSYGRAVIPAELKCDVIQCLELLGIHAKSLQHAGADQVGLQMAWDRKQNSQKANK